MKSLNAKSYKELLIKIIVLTYLLNVLLTPVIHGRTIFFPDKNVDYTFQVIMQYLVVILSIPWGIYLRKSNANILLAGKDRRKKYATIIASAIAIVIICILCPDLLAMGYTTMSLWLIDSIGYDHVIIFAFWIQIFSLYTFLSVLLCLAAVFFYKPVRRGRLSKKDI